MQWKLGKYLGRTKLLLAADLIFSASFSVWTTSFCLFVFYWGETILIWKKWEHLDGKSLTLSSLHSKNFLSDLYLFVYVNVVQALRHGMIRLRVFCCLTGGESRLVKKTGVKKSQRLSLHLKCYSFVRLQGQTKCQNAAWLIQRSMLFSK